MVSGPKAYELPPEWERSIASWLLWLQLGGMSPSTLRLRRGHIRFMAKRSKSTTPQDITVTHIRALCSVPDWSREHRKGVRRSLISFFDWCVQEKMITTNPAIDLPRVRGIQACPRPAPEEMFGELLAAASPRVYLMARLAGEVGMRRAEVAVAHRDDLIDEPGAASMIVHGKGGKQRVVPISDELAQAIRHWAWPGHYLFPGQIDGHISPDYVGRLLSRLMPYGWSMHKLRHRYASRAYRARRNLLAVQALLGHSSVATTQRYVATEDDEIRAAAMAAALTSEKQ